VVWQGNSSYPIDLADWDLPGYLDAPLRGVTFVCRVRWSVRHRIEPIGHARTLDALRSYSHGPERSDASATVSSAWVNSSSRGPSRQPWLAQIRHRKCHNSRSAISKPDSGAPVSVVLGSSDYMPAGLA
jgi:hypothetical protein